MLVWNVSLPFMHDPLSRCPVSCKAVNNSDAGSSLHGQVLKAFTAWIKLNPELTGLPDAALAGHPLVLLSLAALQDAELFDDAVDSTAELISATGLMMNHAQPPSRYMPLVQVLLHTVRLCLDTGFLPVSASIV